MKFADEQLPRLAGVGRTPSTLRRARPRGSRSRPSRSLRRAGPPHASSASPCRNSRPGACRRRWKSRRRAAFGAFLGGLPGPRRFPGLAVAAVTSPEAGTTSGWGSTATVTRAAAEGSLGGSRSGRWSDPLPTISTGSGGLRPPKDVLSTRRQRWDRLQMCLHLMGLQQGQGIT